MKVGGVGAIVAVSFAGLGAGLGAEPAAAQSTSQASPSQTSPSQAGPTQVVVNGQRAEVADRIDRRVYDIKNDPAAQTGTAADILAKLPSVQVTPAGKVTLRGDPGVTVLVDGKQPAAGNAIVQTLSAADIDRIEVMTNPSAQYAPDGAAGIINIITKKRHPLGLSGSVNSRVSDRGELMTGGSMVFTSGAWTIDSRLRYVHSAFNGDSAFSQTAPDAEANDGGWRGAAENVLGNLNIAYKIDDRSTFTLEGQDYRARGRTTVFDTVTAPGLAYSGVNQQSTSSGQRDIEGVYDFNDDKTGSHLTLDADHTDYDHPVHNAETDTYANGSPVTGEALYGSHGNTWGPEDNFKADYERDLPSGQELTAGIELDRRTTYIDRTAYSTGTIPGPEADGFHNAFVGERSIYAAYATYQFALGQWTVLPGLRVEQQRQDVADGGLSASDDRVQLYPSLHLTRPLSKTAKLKFSYSRRVQRPDIADYDPGVVLATPLMIQTGNPLLKPSDIDSWEAGFTDGVRDRTTDVTLFYRVARDQQNEEHLAQAGGLVLDRPVSAGQASYGGLDLTRKAPLTILGLAHWKYSLNATLSRAQVPQLAGGDRAYVGYTANGILEYDATHGDQLQMTVGATGRTYVIDGYRGSTSHVDLTWQHPLNHKVSLVVTASDLFRGNRTLAVVDTPTLRSRLLTQPVDQVLRVALSWKFGGKK